MFPNSISSSRLEILLSELGLSCDNTETLDIFSFENLSLPHLRLSSSGSVPVMVTSDGRPLTGDEMFHYIHDMTLTEPCNNSVCVFPVSDQDKERVIRFQKKLEEVNIGIITYGLAFHPHNTSLLRFPFHDEKYFERSRNYILHRSSKLLDASEKMSQENPEISSQLVRMAEDHQENLAQYLEAEGYDAVLKSLVKVLDYFEDELGQDDRVGQWLGGGQLCIADITLGLYLHRLYQLGLDSEHFQDGVRPFLSVFYQTIRSRPAFRKVIKFNEIDGETYLRNVYMNVQSYVKDVRVNDILKYILTLIDLQKEDKWKLDELNRLLDPDNNNRYVDMDTWSDVGKSWVDMMMNPDYHSLSNSDKSSEACNADPEHDHEVDQFNINKDGITNISFGSYEGFGGECDMIASEREIELEEKVNELNYKLGKLQDEKKELEKNLVASEEFGLSLTTELEDSHRRLSLSSSIVGKGDKVQDDAKLLREFEQQNRNLQRKLDMLEDELQSKEEKLTDIEVTMLRLN